MTRNLKHKRPMFRVRWLPSLSYVVSHSLIFPSYNFLEVKRICQEGHLLSQNCLSGLTKWKRPNQPWRRKTPSYASSLQGAGKPERLRGQGSLGREEAASEPGHVMVLVNKDHGLGLTELKEDFKVKL